MAGPVPMLAYVSTHAHILSPNTNLFLSDWAVYESFKTAFIPGYPAYPVFQANSNPPPLDSSIAEIGLENESQVRLACRYAMCSAAGMSTAAVITNPFADQWRSHDRLHPKWRCDEEGDPGRVDPTNMEAGRMEWIHARCGHAGYLGSTCPLVSSLRA